MMKSHQWKPSSPTTSIDSSRVAGQNSSSGNEDTEDEDTDSEGRQTHSENPEDPIHDDYCVYCGRPIRNEFSETRCTSHITTSESGD